jgi:hypothetical protein
MLFAEFDREEELKVVREEALEVRREKGKGRSSQRDA